MRYRVHVAVLLGLVCLSAKAAEVPASWISQAKPLLADAEYEVTWQSRTQLAGVEAAWQAPNRAHGFRAYFTVDGIRLVPRTEQAPSWNWGLTLVGTGRPGAVVAAEQAKLRVDGNRVTYDRGGIVEWYVNDDEGLEQGFTLASAPTPSRGNVVIDLSLSGSLSAGFSAGGQAVDLKGPDGVAVLRYSGLKVFDARLIELPARMEPLEHDGRPGIRLVFDDANAVYPVTIDPIVKLPNWTVNSGQPSAWFGYSVATAGDVNGDGYSDVIVGAPAYDNGQGDEGRAYVYLGSASGLATTPAWTTESDQANALYGWSVATAGDVNGDGYDEVIVGAQYFTNVEFSEGKAYLYYGSASGLATTAAWTNEPNVGSALYGTAVATAGDVNNDGFADVVVSAPYYGNGRVFLYLGSASGLATTAAWTGVGDQASSGFGDAVATAGDVNGDGYADVIVGADLYDGPQFNGGRAYLYLGVPGGLAIAPVWSFDSGQAGAQLGYSVSTAGDVNGDGYSDVVVGAPYFDNGQDTEGKTYVFHGRPDGLSLVPVWTKEGDNVGARFGVSVGTAGDANGDGYADVIVGADRYFSGEGRVTVYFGSTAGLATTEGFTRYGGVVGTYLGCSVGTAGDVDGDGFSDLIVGSYGFNALVGRATVYQFTGGEDPSTTAAWTGEGNQLSAGYGVSVASAGDVDGDGYSDALVGAYLYDNGQANEGRAYLHLGSSSGLATSASWTVEGDQVVAQMGVSLASAGDVNGDGYSDIIVGANGYPGGGRAFVYHGAPAGPSTGASWFGSSPTGQGEFGYSVASAGDVNGDGYSDVIIGARAFTGDQFVEGAAFVYLGSASGLGASPAWSVEGNQSSSFFGHSVASAGDVNRDGYSDVIVGAYGFDNGQTDEGRAYVYLGSASGLAGVPVWTGESDQAGAAFGSSVASAGDVNGDGYSDVIVSAPSAAINTPGCNVYFGSASGLPALPSWYTASCRNVAPAGDYDNDGYADVLTWPAAKLYRGSASGFLQQAVFWTVSLGPSVLGVGSPIASAGDVNGDGYPDVIVGVNQYTFDQNQEGGAFVYLGGGSAVLGRARHRMPRQMRSDGTTPISLLGKSDSETGFRLLSPGFSAAGRADIRLRWEVKPLGTPFNTGGMGSSAVTDTGTPSIAGSIANFDQLASGLGEGTSYHWRSRTESTNPFFPRSPWMSATGNGHTETKLRMSGCVDLDGDGYGAGGDASCLSATPDCNDQNAAVWSTPGETTNLRFTSGKTSLGWNAPANLGTNGSLIVYDTIRATQPNGFMAGTCVESDNGPDTVASDLDLPPTGQAFYYLNRAQNACPAGVGSLGANSDGVSRNGVSCP